MEDIQIGRFIRDRRIELGMTQQQLADKLGITDKAVSKWERAVSYPDITILRELADALAVSVTELLAGKLDEAPPVPPEVEDVVVGTVAYAETSRRRNGGWRWWLFVGVSAGCAIAALVLCIVDRFRFQGSLIPLQCIAFGWAVCYPLLRTRRNPIRNAMVIASVAVYPFIWSLGARRAWHLGVVVVSLAFMWAVYWIFLRARQPSGAAVMLILLLGGLLHVSVNCLVDASLYGAVVVTGGTLFLDFLFLAAAWALALRQTSR